MAISRHLQAIISVSLLIASINVEGIGLSCRTPEGIVYEDGATFPKDCNQCQCDNGVISCTEKECLPDCVFNCTNVADGDYQSCKSCNVYVTCSNELTTDNRPCPASLVWNDTAKRCDYTSDTCETCGVNEAFYYGQCRCKPGFKLERGKCVYDCTRISQSNPGRAGRTFIVYPGAEVLCRYRKDFFTYTLESCLNDCRRFSQCRSAVYYNSGRCYHSSCDPLHCVFNCTNVADGDYQSCKSCKVYVTCSNELTTDNRPCPASLVWNDTAKRCDYTSDTCETCGVNEAFYYGQCRCKPGFKLERGKCVYDCTRISQFNPGRAGRTFIAYPGAEVLCRYRKDFFTYTLESCLNDCRRFSQCRSAVYYNSGRCYHSPCDPLRDLEFKTQPTFIQNPDATLYVRNCVL